MDTTPDAVNRIAPTNRHGGAWVLFGEDEYRVPAINYAVFVDMQAEVNALKDLKEMPTSAQMATLEKIIHRALQRNYPDMTLAMVSDMLDLSSAQAALVAAMGAFVPPART